MSTYPPSHAVDLSEEEFRLLRDFIHEALGLYYDDNHKTTLRDRLAGRVAGLDLRSFEDYYRYLRFGPHRDEELRRMASHLTNNETYFYREAGQLKIFGDSILRSLKEKKSAAGDRRLRICSVGCSTGEEVYTLAMIVFDSGQFFWSWDVQITGLDVDTTALERARRAVYFHNSFRALPVGALDRHFQKQGAGSQVKENVRKFTRFRQGSLLDPESYADVRPLDVISCRNVFIYFSNSAILRAVRIFFELLAPGGYLLLGHAESLSRVTDAFLPIRFPGAMVYQKPETAP